jgi:hypothetical protein
MLISFMATAVAAAVIGSPPLLDDKEVARAIDQANRLTDPTVCIGTNAAGEFSVCIQGPEQRIGAAALMAKRTRRRLRSSS